MNKMRYNLLSLLVAMIPAAATCLLIYVFYHALPTDYFPYWNDELDYWHQILSFTHHGFGGGYYSIEEKIAPAAFSHFGTHGPVFPLFYGMIGRFFGWTAASGPLFNFAVITMAGFIFLLQIKPSGKQLLLTSFALISFWPLLLYLPTTMQEPLQMALALLLAGLFGNLLAGRTASRKTLLITLAVLIFASLLRASWGILFLPLLLISGDTRTLAATTRLLAAGVLCLAASLFIFTFLAAPYPNNFVNSLLAICKVQPLKGWAFFIDHMNTNLRSYFSWQKGEPLETAVRYQLLIVPILAIGSSLLSSLKQCRQEAIVHFCNVILMLLLAILLYDINDWRAYRILSPHLLFSLALFIYCQRVAAASVLISLSLVFTLNFATLYPVFHRNHFTNNHIAAADFKAAYGEALRFRQNVSPWDNSILIGVDDLPSFLAGLPSGIGINCVLDWSRIDYPLKSAYVMIPPNIYDQLADKVNLRMITSGRFGVLYMNLDNPHNRLKATQTML